MGVSEIIACGISGNTVPITVETVPAASRNLKRWMRQRRQRPVSYTHLAIILTGIGAAVTVDVNIVPNPADGLARVLGERCGKNMGFGKNLFDFSALVISLAIGMIGAGRPVGIGSGTVVAMVCTGRVIALFNYFGKKKIEEITIA